MIGGIEMFWGLNRISENKKENNKRCFGEFRNVRYGMVADEKLNEGGCFGVLNVMEETVKT